MRAFACKFVVASDSSQDKQQWHWTTTSVYTTTRKAGRIPRVSTRFSLSVENEQADAGRDVRTCLATPSSQARRGTEKKINISPVQLTTNNIEGSATLPGWSILLLYVCMYVCMGITYSRVWINQVRLPILLVVS